MTFETLKECVLDLREALKRVSQAEKSCDASERRQIMGLRLHTLLVFTDFYQEYLARKAAGEGGTDGEGTSQE